MAASGALPLPPPQLVTVLYALTLDPDAAVKDKALASLKALPDRVLDPALDAKLHPDVLGLCAGGRSPGDDLSDPAPRARDLLVQARPHLFELRLPSLRQRRFRFPRFAMQARGTENARGTPHPMQP